MQALCVTCFERAYVTSEGLLEPHTDFRDPARPVCERSGSPANPEMGWWKR
jgi:hypothetical protein